MALLADAQADRAGDGGEVEDAAPALALEDGEHLVHELELRVQVGVDSVLPQRLADFAEA